MGVGKGVGRGSADPTLGFRDALWGGGLPPPQPTVLFLLLVLLPLYCTWLPFTSPCGHLV